MKQLTTKQNTAHYLLLVMLVLAMAFMLGLMNLSFAAEEGDAAGGSTWNYDADSATLTVGGSGKLEIEKADQVPWIEYRGGIRHVVIEEGITGIDGPAFAQYEALEDVTLAASVAMIGAEAFHDDAALVEVKHPDGNCSLARVPDDLEDEDYTYHDAFMGCDTANLQFDVPMGSEMARYCDQYGYRIKGQKGSLKGAQVGPADKSAWFEEPGEYRYFTKLKYTGKERKPVPEVRLYGKKLKYGKDYTCAYKSNVSVGRAVVTVKGKGNYRGSQEVDFAIYPKGTSIVKLKAGKNSLKVKWLVQDKKMKNKHIDGYRVEISEYKTFGASKRYTIYGYKHMVKIKRNLKPGKYYVRVATFVNYGDPDLFSSWSPVKSVVVK